MSETFKNQRPRLTNIRRDKGKRTSKNNSEKISKSNHFTFRKAGKVFFLCCIFCAVLVGSRLIYLSIKTKDIQKRIVITNALLEEMYEGEMLPPILT